MVDYCAARLTHPTRYTGTIGSGAVAPALYGLVGDAIGVPMALTVVAAVCLLTLPLAVVLRPALPAAAR